MALFSFRTKGGIRNSLKNPFGASSGVQFLGLALFNLSATQSTVVVNGRVEYDVISQSSGFGATLTNSGANQGQIALTAGQYLAIHSQRGSINNGSFETQLRNVTDAVELESVSGEEVMHAFVTDESARSANNNATVASLFALTAAKTIEQRVTVDTNVSGIFGQQTSLILMKFSGLEFTTTLPGA